MRAFSTRELCHLMGVKIHMLHRPINEGRLKPPMKIGENYVWSEADVNRASLLIRGRDATDLLPLEVPTSNVAVLA